MPAQPDLLQRSRCRYSPPPHRRPLPGLRSTRRQANGWSRPRHRRAAPEMFNVKLSHTSSLFAFQRHRETGAPRQKASSAILWTDHFHIFIGLAVFMSTSASANAVSLPSAEPRARTRHILSFVYFTFNCYLSIGLPLAVL